MTPTDFYRRPWLVGGGLQPLMAYGELRARLGDIPPFAPPPASVFEVLYLLTSAWARGGEIELGELFLAGEVPVSAPGPHASVAVGDSSSEPPDDFCARVLQSTEAAVILLTSGTSGAPRRVRHRLPHLLRSVVRSPRHRDDVWGLAFNPTHIAGVQVYLQALANGNTLVNLWGLDPAAARARCEEWGVTHLSATPTFYRLLLAQNQTLAGMRSISVGGEVADAGLIAGLRSAFPDARLHNLYASTEAGTVLRSEGSDFVIPPAEAHRIQIRDGRLWLHRSLLADFAGASEWYDTGDSVVVSASDPARFSIVGRDGSTWVNVGGEKVNPVEVEAVLGAHDKVVAARVFGRRNSVTGELLAAEVVRRDEALTELQLRDYLAAVLPAHKVPRIIRFVDRLELTRTGKVPRHV